MCSTCKDALVKGNVPRFSTTNGYVCPPLPPHLPKLNTSAERLIAPCLPFICIRRLTNGSGQFGIKGQVVNELIDMQETLHNLPREIAYDATIEVRIKRRLLSKPTYKMGLVKKSNMELLVAFLLDTPLYKHYRVSVGRAKLNAIFDHDEEEEGIRRRKSRRLSRWTIKTTMCTVGRDARGDSNHSVRRCGRSWCWRLWCSPRGSGVLPAHSPCEGQVPISLLCNKQSEELALP